jgi:hypothetical protein
MSCESYLIGRITPHCVVLGAKIKRGALKTQQLRSYNMKGVNHGWEGFVAHRIFVYRTSGTLRSEKHRYSLSSGDRSPRVLLQVALNVPKTSGTLRLPLE